MAVTHKIGISSFTYCFACGSRPFAKPQHIMTPRDLIDKAVVLGTDVVQFGDNMPLEIYNENIHDLLTDSNYLKLVEDSKYGVIVAGAKRVKINNFEDGIGIKDFGEENRKYRETLFNEYSSRSHTIFQIFIESTEIIKSNNENNENDNDNIINNNENENMNSI